MKLIITMHWVHNMHGAAREYSIPFFLCKKELIGLHNHWESLYCTHMLITHWHCNLIMGNQKSIPISKPILGGWDGGRRKTNTQESQFIHCACHTEKHRFNYPDIATTDLIYFPCNLLDFHLHSLYSQCYLRIFYINKYEQKPRLFSKHSWDIFLTLPLLPTLTD